MSDFGKNEAYELMQDAEKALKKFRLFGSKRKYEDAEELFTKAGNKFKMLQMWSPAGGAFVRAAECHQQLDSRHEAAVCLVKAAQCYKKSNMQEAVQCLEQALNIFCELGRFESAARYEREIAEMYENEMQLEEALDHYHRAAELFAGEESKSHGNKCWLKVADLAAQLQQWERAIELYEQVSRDAVDNRLLKWSVKDYLIKAALCQLVKGTSQDGDIHDAEGAISRYEDLDVRFSSSREGKLVRDILQACEEHDPEKFTSTVAEYDSMSRLDQWFTSVLLKIKQNISEEESLV